MPADIVRKINTEEELEEHLFNITQNFGEKDIENVDDDNIDEINNKNISPLMDTEEDYRFCHVHEKYNEEISCFECIEYFHSTCTFVPESEIPLCHLCAKKTAIESSRKHCKRGLEEQAEKKIQTSQKFPPVFAGDNILVNIPDMDRGRLAPRNVLAVVMEVVEPNLFSIGTKHGKLEKLYSRNEFQLAPHKFMKISDVPDGKLSVRQEAMIASGSKQGFVKCGCSKGCNNKSCSCAKKKLKCNSKCHNSSACKNK